MNPLDLTAGPFLSLYVFIVLITIMFASWMRRELADNGRHERAGLTVPELAYLAGGRERLGDAVLVGMLSTKAATLLPDGTVDIDREKVDALPQFAPFRFTGKISRAEFQARIDAQANTIHGKLQQLGLMLSPYQLDQYRRYVVGIFAIPVVLGLMKVLVGLSRDKPVGFLIVLIIGTVIVAASYMKMQQMTSTGRQTLSVSRSQNARAARAPLEGELMLAVALGGLIVLAGTPFDALYQASRTTTGDSGGSGGDAGGSGCGGGGCGGCGGCGSG